MQISRPSEKDSPNETWDVIEQVIDTLPKKPSEFFSTFQDMCLPVGPLGLPLPFQFSILGQTEIYCY